MAAIDPVLPPPLPKSAAEASPKDESNWRDLVTTARDSGRHEQAVEFAKQGIREHPRSDWLWQRLGGELTGLDRLDEAEKALKEARRLNPNADGLWRYLAGLHRKRKNFEKEIEALEHLCELGKANAADLNQLGIAYRRHGNYYKAVEYYRRSAATKPSASQWHNMGLVYNEPEVSQDADAADSYRRALALDPNLERAKEQLQTTKRKIVPLANQVRTAATTDFVQPDELFASYLSPFEMLQIKEGAAVEQPDVKSIQRAKKLLLGEIKLNDGKVGWLDDYPLDMARALAIVDELDDESKRRYHWAVFQNKRLLRFLSRGEIDHFLYSDDYFPQATLDLLDKEPEFRSFLSEPFAKQYNVVLTRAIYWQLLPVVEVLFDGRRWVKPEDDDICFEGASQLIGELVQKMQSKAKDGCARKVSLREMEDFLRQDSFPELFNLLPTHFAEYQRDVVAAIRDLAIDCFNEHHDSDLAKGILSLGKRFTSRSVELTKNLEEDSKAIEEIIAKERDTRQIVAQQQHNQESFIPHQLLGWVVFGVFWLIIAGISSVIDSCSLTKTAPNGGSHASPVAPRVPAYNPPVAPRVPAYSPPFAPDTPGSESKTVYRVPHHISAELNRDSRVIDGEKATAERMEGQLESLGREIEQKRSHLNRANQSDVYEFNRKVDAYNSLLGRVRAQNRLVNQLVESYNDKLQKNGR